MAVTVQMQCESAVTERYQDAFGGSAIENGTTIIPCALRKHDLHQELGAQAPRCWHKEASHVKVHALSTFHTPMQYRCLFAQGSYLDGEHQRGSFTPAIKGLSTSQQMRHSVIRLACSLAVVCGGSLRHMALRFAALFLIPIPPSSIQRWIDAIGSHLPTPEERLRQLLVLAPATACHIDGAYPWGTDHGVMGVKDAPGRILMTHAAASEHGDDAQQFLPHLKDLGLKVTAACSDDSHRCTEAITAVSPQARFQAAHFQTVTNIWGPLKQSLLSSRRQVKASGAEKHEEQLLAWAKQLWKLRWSLLKKPATISVEEKQAIAALTREDAGFVHRFRRIIRQLVHIFDQSHSAAHAKLNLKQLRKDSQALGDHHLEKIPQCFADHWEQALRYLRKQGMGKHRRGSNSESGMRLLRRLEKNHEGLRSAATRQHYMQIYQAITSLSFDVAECIEQGPQRAELPCV